uniref:Pyrin domain-containing protein n=1 Tax=Labrus bergylta TaxID=56723 RepID=A0A3Q3FSZ7_9LABR
SEKRSDEPQLLLEILHSLNNGEFRKFRKFLLSAFQKDSKDIPLLLRYSNDRTKILDVMVQTYGRQSVDETREILKKLMNRTDLVGKLSESSSVSKGKFKKKVLFDYKTLGVQNLDCIFKPLSFF